MTPHLRGHLTNAIEVCRELLDRISAKKLARRGSNSPPDGRSGVPSVFCKTGPETFTDALKTLKSWVRNLMGIGRGVPCELTLDQIREAEKFLEEALRAIRKHKGQIDATPGLEPPYEDTQE